MDVNLGTVSFLLLVFCSVIAGLFAFGVLPA
jgi:hypothetical protein